MKLKESTTEQEKCHANKSLLDDIATKSFNKYILFIYLINFT